MRKLKANDLVTVVLLNREPHGPLSRTIVNQVGQTRFSAIDDDRAHHAFADEGITWVRGRVYEDTPEGKALIAASALAPLLPIAFTFTAFTFTASVGAVRSLHNPLSPPPILRVGNNPNPKNELGE